MTTETLHVAPSRTRPPPPPGVPRLRFYRCVFAAAAIYNLIWGTLVVLLPLAPFRWAGMTPPDPVGVVLWQCVGMFVLTYAVGYAYVAIDPVRYAPFALVGLIGKVCGPIGWAWAWSQGVLPAVSGLTILANDLVWWPAFVAFVWQTMAPRRRGGAGQDGP